MLLANNLIDYFLILDYNLFKDIMKKLVTLIMIVILGMSMLSGCDFFSGNSDSLTISGYVYLNSVEPLEGVSIKSETTIYARTDVNGFFNITVNNDSVELFAEKTGYTFSPRSVTISQSTNSLIFSATKTKELSGLLTLNSIIITPTSIVSFGDNYTYTHNGDKCLKISDIEININNKQFDLLDGDLYAIKNKSNTVMFDEDVTLNTSSVFNIWFSVDAYFTSLNEELIFEEDRQSVIRVQEKQTTEDLDDKNQIVYTAVGVNSSNNMFTYNISFVFDYYENV